MTPSPILDIEPKGPDKNNCEKYGESVCSTDKAGAASKREDDTSSSSKEKTSVSRYRSFGLAKFRNDLKQ